MASINTNYGAAIALQNLNKTSSELERTQNRINTGMKVSSAKDSGAIFSIATSQRAAAASQDAVRSGLQRTQSITDVALAAGDTITSALEEMKGLAVSIAGSTGNAQTSYLAEYNALGTEIASAITGASFIAAKGARSSAATSREAPPPCLQPSSPSSKVLPISAIPEGLQSTIRPSCTTMRKGRDFSAVRC